MKVVRKEFFKQDPKVRENLEREIRILKLLRGCECVVHLFHVQVDCLSKNVGTGAVWICVMPNLKFSYEGEINSVTE